MSTPISGKSYSLPGKVYVNTEGANQFSLPGKVYTSEQLVFGHVYPVLGTPGVFNSYWLVRKAP